MVNASQCTNETFACECGRKHITRNQAEKCCEDENVQTE